MKAYTKSSCHQEGHVDYVHPQGKYAYCKSCREERRAVDKANALRAAKRAEKRAERNAERAVAVKQEQVQATSDRLTKTILFLTKDNDTLKKSVINFILEQN